MRPGKTLLLVLMVAPGVVVQGFGVRLGVNPRALGSSTLSAPLQHAVEGVFVSTRVEYRKERDTAAVGGRLGMCAASDRGSGAGGSGGGGKENRRDRKQEETDDDPIMAEVKQRDWRLFRANLISQFDAPEGYAKSEWGEGCWAHELGRLEPGCLLIASEEIWDGPFRQSVVIMLSHDTEVGSVGLMLNQPGTQRLHTLQDLKQDVSEVFADSKLFDGGPVGLGTMTVVHATEGVEGSQQVLPGMFAGGFDSLVQMARQGSVAKDRVRFIHGHSAWGPGQLEKELERGQWFLAAAAPQLLTAGCDRPTNPLWAQILSLMGGKYQQVAKRNDPSA